MKKKMTTEVEKVWFSGGDNSPSTSLKALGQWGMTAKGDPKERDKNFPIILYFQPGGLIFAFTFSFVRSFFFFCSNSFPLDLFGYMAYLRKKTVVSTCKSASADRIVFPRQLLPNFSSPPPPRTLVRPERRLPLYLSAFYIKGIK